MFYAIWTKVLFVIYCFFFKGNLKKCIVNAFLYNNIYIWQIEREILSRRQLTLSRRGQSIKFLLQNTRKESKREREGDRECTERDEPIVEVPKTQESLLSLSPGHYRTVNIELYNKIIVNDVCSIVK